MVISGIVRKPDFEGSFLFESIIFNKANIALSKQGKDSDCPRSITCPNEPAGRLSDVCQMEGSAG